MKKDTWEELVAEVLADPVARRAYNENELRRKIGDVLNEAREAKGLSISALAKAMDTSVLHIKQLLHKDVGGSITLRTLCRITDILGLNIDVHVRPKSVDQEDKEKCKYD